MLLILLDPNPNSITYVLQPLMGKHTGLSKLKYYCQACRKQCRDEHGFQLHNASLSHTTRCEGTESGGCQYQQKQKWSSEFETQFLKFFNGYKSQVPINRVYNDFIKDSSHTHMTATKWSSLTSFTQHLQRKKKIVIIATEPELIVERVDLEAQARTERHAIEKKRQADERLATQRAIAACIETTHEPSQKPLTVTYKRQEPQSAEVKEDNKELKTINSSKEKNPPTRIGFKLKTKTKSNGPVSL